MSVRGFGLAAILFAAGALLSFGVVSAFASEAEQETTPTTAPVVTTTVPTSFHVAADERIVGPAALVPVGFSHDGNEAAFEYELHGLAPLDGLEPIESIGATAGLGALLEVDPADVDPVFPASWTLITANGEVEGATANPRSRVARFRVPDGFTPDDVAGVRLDTYMVRVPIAQPLGLPRVGQVEVVPGVVMSVIQVVEQGDQTIVQVEVATAFAGNADGITVEGDGPGWLSAGREAEGRPRWNLRYDGVDLAEDIPLRLRGSVWMEFTEAIEFDIRGLP